MPPRKKKPTTPKPTPSAKKKPPKAPEPSTPVETIKHKDTRSNIPTRELGKFANDDERKPKSILYPRDPSLDPQLVWKGKDEQDRNPLEVPAVPIYIQEKIHPQALVEEVRLRAEREKRGEKPVDLFADFNGLDDFEKKVDFYKHDQHWTNRMILGDSLLVMTSLAEKERLKGRVQMIYLDPPYGIKFGSNWQVSTRKRDVKDAKVDDLTRQPEQIKAFRDTWELGINSYLTFWRDRLTVARDLLTETGSIFVQIGDENVHLVRSVMDEVFGSENFVSLISCAKTTSTTGEFLPGTNDFVLWFAKVRERATYRPLFIVKEAGGVGASAYGRLELPDGTRRPLTPAEKANPNAIPKNARYFRLDNLTSPRVREARTGYYPIEFGGRRFLPNVGEWKTHTDGMLRLKIANRLGSTDGGLYYIRYIDDFPAFPINNSWTDTVVAGFASDKVYVVQTNPKIIERCLLMTTDPGDLVLDPTCGSGTTPYVAEQWGRRWITIDTSRVALALARTRLMAARFPYYLLADSVDGRKKEFELIGGNANLSDMFTNDIRRGFVYKRVPHVTLKSIANNPDIKEGMTRDQISVAIQKHAETETLFDQPYEDKGTIRVSGPFTVESLSPHRMLPTAAPLRSTAFPGGDESAPPPGKAELRSGDESDFVHSILENLRKAGVQNTVKKERLTFDRLDPAGAGVWIQAEGDYAEGSQRRRVKVCIGPQFGTVAPELMKEAAKEAVQGFGCDLLLVCGFAFDPHVGEEAKQYGKLRILCTKMNPDLALGHDMLKKTGAGNLFMVFGEPDIDIIKQKDGKIVVEVKGLDVFDPTTGAIRSHSTDDIACWFIDSAYNGESFFVRHAYFCGGNEPYEKLKRALKAEVDEAEWAKLYSTKSVPFAPPPGGKIAVKVINHYGDEVLKVYGVK
jgi:adenine-specific DNA-methyltransferase